VSDPVRPGEVELARLVPYRSPIEDNHRWAGFTHRPGDIFVCTPPKCGTTWTQTIVTTLIFGGTPPDPVLMVSPWLEMRLFPIDEVLDRLDAQTHRRVIKSHTPADGIPWWDDAAYLVVGRDGRDVAMSLLNHLRSSRPEVILAQVSTALAEGIEVPAPPPTDDVHEFFAWFVESGPYFPFFARFWDRHRLPNVLFVHYNDLTSDLDGEMRRIASFLDLPVDEERWAGLVESCTFEAMKARPDEIAPFDLVFDGGADAFLYKGTNGRWREVLTAEEVATYERAAATRLPPDAVAWLSGARVPGVSD
jgi:aryl sulfotransferase